MADVCERGDAARRGRVRYEGELRVNFMFWLWSDMRAPACLTSKYHKGGANTFKDMYGVR